MSEPLDNNFFDRQRQLLPYSGWVKVDFVLQTVIIVVLVLLFLLGLAEGGMFPAGIILAALGLPILGIYQLISNILSGGFFGVSTARKWYYIGLAVELFAFAGTQVLPKHLYDNYDPLTGEWTAPPAWMDSLFSMLIGLAVALPFVLAALSWAMSLMAYRKHPLADKMQQK